MALSLIDQIDETASVLRDFIQTAVGETKPVAAFILGSGLNFYADTLNNKHILPYAQVPHMKVSTATGHIGQFVLGTVDNSDTWLLCMQGRLHEYEGVSAQDVALPVWTMQKAGIDTLITTNAVGALNPNYSVGSFCVMSDHINFTGRNPLACVEANQMAERFVPMLDAYDPTLRIKLLEIAARENIEVHEGVYLSVLGPNFETPAEVRLFASWGADTVAMSLVEEVLAARHVGMRVMGFSLVSNMACGIEGADPNSEEVMDVALAAEPNFKTLMDAFLKELSEFE